MHKRKREQVIEEEESKIKRKDKETIKILEDSLITVSNEMFQLKAYVKDLHSTINEQNSKINEQNSKINELNYKINELNYQINIFEIQRQKDQIKIAELSDFIFQAKLRKLLKKILEYIVSQENLSNHLYFDSKERRWSFISVPNGISINGISNSQILDALNTMLRIIFTYTTNASYSIHFVNKEAISDIRLKKKIEVFNKFQEFFKYFKIEKLQNILTKVIPLPYFTTIYNTEFDLKLPSIMEKVKKK